MGHHKRAKQGRLDHSGQWLLEGNEYQNWRKESSTSLFWLLGIRESINLGYFCVRSIFAHITTIYIAGAGKTKLTSVLHLTCPNIKQLILTQSQVSGHRHSYRSEECGQSRGTSDILLRPERARAARPGTNLKVHCQTTLISKTGIRTTSAHCGQVS